MSVSREIRTERKFFHWNTTFWSCLKNNTFDFKKKYFWFRSSEFVESLAHLKCGLKREEFTLQRYFTELNFLVDSFMCGWSHWKTYPMIMMWIFINGRGRGHPPDALFTINATNMMLAWWFQVWQWQRTNTFLQRFWFSFFSSDLIQWL